MKTVGHSAIFIPSLWRVLPITLSSPTDLPSLTNVTLKRFNTGWRKITVHTKSLSSSSPSFLDITPALQRYIRFPLSFTHNRAIPFTSFTILFIHHQSESLITAIIDNLNPSIKSHRIALPATVTNHSKYYILSILYNQLYPFLLTNTHKRRIP